ncbi:MAG: carbohydrate ABC transporter permease [Anaerolineae bacterium]
MGAREGAATLTSFARLSALLQTRKIGQGLGTAILTLLVAAGGVVLMMPLAWMISTSLKPLGQIWIFPPQWIPSNPLWHNYLEVFTARPYLLYVRNAIYIVVVAEIGTLLSCSLVAYGFARLRFPGREFLFMVLLGTMMIPGYVTLIPIFIFFKNIGWLDTYNPLLVPAFFGTPVYIFLLRQFYMTIPLEMDDAAKIDGCGYLGIYWRILLPLVKPALAAVAIFTFMGRWNDYFGPLIFLMDERKWPVALGLLAYQFGKSSYYIQWNVLMAASALTLVPCLLLFFLAQRIFIQGVVITGVEK